MSDKIMPQHLARKTMRYVRQSSTYQVIHNLESQKLQYAMEERLRLLGWRDSEVVDEDLGRSASGTVTRAGFDVWWPGVLRKNRSGCGAGGISFRALQPGVATTGGDVSNCR